VEEFTCETTFFIIRTKITMIRMILKYFSEAFEDIAHYIVVAFNRAQMMKRN
jgi:hypothetical protein